AFAARVESERARSAGTGGFAVVLVRFQGMGPWAAGATQGETRGSAVADDKMRAARIDRGLAELLRASGVLGYLGPAEYGVLVPGATREMATEAASRLRAGLSAHEVPADVGAGVFPEDGPSLLDLLRAAASCLAPLAPSKASREPVVRGALERLGPMVD